MRPLRTSDPATVGPYRLLAEIGRGGMGRVLLAAAPDGRLLAVKQVHARFAADEGFRARFRREVAATRKVSGAFTAAVLDADADAERPWLASVFVSGPALGGAVEQSGPLPVEAVRRLAAGLAAALTEIHRVGLIHRDLKPENVLLAEDGVRVIDFGIARAAESADATGLTGTGWVVGSPAFMSPEQAQGEEPTPASDVFSLGAVLAMAATGASPFEGTSVPQTLYQVVHSEPELSAVPAELLPVIEPCLAKDPGARPAPAEVLALVGALAPRQHPWPESVHRMISGRQAEIDGLSGRSGEAGAAGGPGGTGGIGETLGLRPASMTPTPTALATAFVAEHEQATVSAPAAPGTAVLTQLSGSSPSFPSSPSSPSSTGRRRSARCTAALVALGLVLVAGAGVGVYAATADSGSGEPRAGASAPGEHDAGPAADQQPEDENLSDQHPADQQTESPSTTPDKYSMAPVCAEAAPQLPLPERDKSRDRYNELSQGANTTCGWAEPGVYSADAVVSWELNRTVRGSTDSGTETQRARFRDLAEGERPEKGLDFGDEAFWDQPDASDSYGSDFTCDLTVRDGNLRVSVGLGGETFPAGDCEGRAEEIARAALKAMPRG
ncbi:serine/threonine protein kinase [Streptomyces sp. NA04227]|uniref:serine/threonine-protein kinase n=1 Tax=Streptomyces sp. NA04227 TaxID=2742136 RepID=UPI0015905850|nr:serine/threonine-protein kinase [Streptomyces sp. NA04227]QKW08186.1 serine/threonine protein kinase [Streptomyces sp. NA04227]